MTRKLPGKPVSRRRALGILAGSAGAAAGFPTADAAIASSQSDAALERAGKEVDLAELGRERVWERCRGVEWDEPRDVKRVEVDFQEVAQLSPADTVRVEYW